ncbi:peptidoglycan editing factor PgeF [Phormidium sp. CCY1219]|uniref:peptidoglycan editing factor PgeF n=1 Tax=Phormidium sp. CCY1219 TaxID=2886104 RepID=UPI002D1ECACC|nr:peptidoglycan editing factor PgeF [Phormidium sp. CCY1219]MEB3831731.1 peptidoglycan editing factor PgeF [Phormidium sp. CCY1219]
MHTWHWHSWNGLPYLSCSLLSRWPHGFFTQQFWPRSPTELVEVLQPTARVYRVTQVHGNRVVNTREMSPEVSSPDGQEILPSKPDADGLLTHEGDRAVWVCTADCSPVLIADPQTGQVAAIHAGWRGTAARIIPEAIAQMQAQGSSLPQLQVAIGPAIAGEVYQVQDDVAAQVCGTIVETDTPEQILSEVQQLPHPPVLADAEPGRVRLDVRRVIQLQLAQMGIARDAIAIAPYCTYQNPDRFFSYRREAQKKVQWSGIVSQ